ncbi:MAG TPA: GTP-binding protein [Acetobacteraceae bacterium]|nr:GTP-binding protein [Acetobacteraceae bacterium]
MTRHGRCAITILSGFLGSGKTTLLRRYLAEQARGDVHVIINEYGEVGIDHHLVHMVEDQTVLLQGGCVCCGRREELVSALRDLLDQEQTGAGAIRQVVIETSGLADPVPVIFSLATDPVLRHQFAVPLVVVTLAAIDAEAQIRRYEEVRKQIITADRVIITKSDLTTQQEVARCRVAIRALNPTARMIVSPFGEAFDSLAPDERQDDGRRREIMLRGSIGQPQQHPSVQSASLALDSPLDWTGFGVWLSMLLQVHGPNVLRIKGLLDIGDAGPVAMNVAQHVVHPPEHLPGWPSTEHRSHLVFITRVIDPVRVAYSLETFQRAAGRSDLRVQRLG